ncbi:MAG TPA: ABC transporter ATP-binding protein [Actinomycetota bacterium]|nr:ABC transporter ATP-binding protein [Actinomycetota bacterium]
MATVIELENVTKWYGRRRGIEDVTFSVEAGEVFGYLGPNGAGKTTTIRLLVDLIRPTGGRARVLGMDPRRDAVEIHRRLGYLPGEFGLYDHLTGLEYLTYLANLRGGLDERSVRQLADRLDLDLTVRIRALSHGNKQKLGLVQAFMHEPDVLILDEPTQGLDPLVQQTFHALLAESRRAGRTVFLSSHVMPEVERLCDRVGIVREGRLVAVEDIAELKAKEFRTVEVRIAGPTPDAELTAVPGVRDVRSDGEVVRFTVVGEMDGALKALARHRVIDLVSHEPSLEDLFLAFYGGADGAS